MEKKKFRFKGVHHCDSVVLTCIDFRFWVETIDFLSRWHGVQGFDFPSLPGSAKALNEDDSLAWKCISVPVELHQIKNVYIVHHADCGAYGGVKEFDGDIEAEQKFHEAELKKAKEKILAKFTEVKVVMIYAKLVDSGENIEFIEIK
jgi:hypothetical protein